MDPSNGDGDADLPPPQPVQPVLEDLYLLATSSNVDDNIQALTRIRDTPAVYTEVTPDLNGLFNRSLLNATDSLRSIAREAFLALAAHVGRVRDTVIINSLFVPLTRFVISCDDLPSERPDDGSTLAMLADLASSLPQAVVPHLAAITVHFAEKAWTSKEKALNLLESLSQNATDLIPGQSLPEIVDSCLVTMTDIHEISVQGIHRSNGSFSMKELRVGSEATLGKDCLTRIVTNLHERAMVAVTIEQTGRFLMNDDWKFRTAGIMGLEVIGTTGRIQMIDQIVTSLSRLLKDTDERVPGAACKALALMAPNFGHNPTFLENEVPVLIDAMAHRTVYLVASRAAEALYSFTKHCPQHVMANLDCIISDVVKNFEEIAYKKKIDDFRDDLTRYQLNIVSTLASASIPVGSSADSIMENAGIERIATSLRLSTDQFAAIYDRLIEPLKWMLPNRYLIVPTLECISRMAIAVGMTKFFADSSFVLNAVMTRFAFMHTEDWAAILLSLRGITCAMGKEVVPHLSLLMPSIIRAARFDTSDIYDEQELETRELCSQRACGIISDLAGNLKGQFVPYVKESSLVYLYNLKTNQLTISLSFHLLLECVKETGVYAMRALWVPAWNALKAVLKSCDQIFYNQFLAHICNSIHRLGPEGLSTTEVHEIGTMLRRVVEKGAEKLLETSNFAYIVAVTVQNLFETTGPNCYSTIHGLIPSILSTMKKSMYQLTVIGNYIFNTPQLALIHYESIDALIYSSLTHELPQYRQQAYFAIGYIAHSKCPQWTPLVARSIPIICQAISRSDARDGNSCIQATENAIIAAAKIIKHCYEIDIVVLLSSYVEWLSVHGIVEEKDEAHHAYAVLVDLVKAGNSLIIGENNNNWPKLIRIFVQALTRDVFVDSAKAVKIGMEKLIRDMKHRDEQFFVTCVHGAGLNGEEKKKLDHIMN